MYIHRFLLTYGGGASTGLVGATCFVVPVVCGYFLDVVVVVVDTTLVYYVVLVSVVVGCGVFYTCIYCLFFMFYRMFIYLRIVFWIYLSMVLMVSGGVYLSICAYFF